MRAWHLAVGQPLPPTSGRTASSTRMKAGVVLACLSCALWQAMEATGQGLITRDIPQLGASSSMAADLRQAYTRAQAIQQNSGSVLSKASSCSKGGSGCALASSGDSSDDINLQYAAFELALSPLSWSARDSQLTYGVNVISPSIDQRPCSTCTAMAVTSAAETAVAMVLKIDVSQVDLSEMDLYYCSTGTKRKCDSGATLEDIVNDLFSRQLLRASCLPYKAALGLSSSVCTTNACNDMNIQASKGNFEAVTLRNPYDVMEHIRMYGSVVAQFLITKDFVAFFKDTTNKQAIYKYPDKYEAQEMHAVVLVGYHLDFSDFSRSYWLVKNSWGPDWADNGFFKLSLSYSNFKDPTAYGIVWKPDLNDMPDYAPLEGLKRAEKAGCCVYKATKYDLLSRVAMQAQVDVLQLLGDNTAIGVTSGNLAGRNILLCGSPVCNDAIGDSAANTAGAAATGRGAPDYALTLRRSTKSQEVDCGYIDEYNRRVPYCKVCGGVEAVASQCDANPKCMAFDMMNPMQLDNGTVVECGFLKAATKPLEYMEGYSNYCKLSKDNDCKGTYTYRRGLSLPRTAAIDCNYKDKDGIKQRGCFVSGSVMCVTASCNDNPQCKAFDYYQSLKGGWLKSSTDSPVPMLGSAMYMKSGSR